jgi:Fe2+ transport system protein FeoA
MTASRLALSRVPLGVSRTIVSVEAAARVQLGREGLFAGDVVVVVSRTPLGGPVVIRRGRTRLALSAKMAASVLTDPLVAAGEPA